MKTESLADFPNSLSHGLRRNHAVYGQQMVSLGRLALVAGARYVHNESFGNKGVPRVAASFMALHGGEFFLRHAITLRLCHRNQGTEIR